jgi:hypothetical protein
MAGLIDLNPNPNIDNAEGKDGMCEGRGRCNTMDARTAVEEGSSSNQKQQRAIA